jgi:two-component system LytT family response regulator
MNMQRLAAAAAGAGTRSAEERRLRVVIADDEPRARQFLERLLSEHDDLEIVGVARGGAEALTLVSEQQPDVTFLDIHMPDLSGLEVARHLRGNQAPVIVFVTAYDQHAVEAFELAALDYVLKPIRRERLAETVRRVVEEVRQQKDPVRGQDAAIQRLLDTPGMAGRTETLRRLPVRHRREVKLLDLSEVSRIVSRDRLVLACAGAHEYMVDYTLQELETRLPPGQFVRVHRAALVNIDSIESYGGEDGVLVLRLKDGARIEASERRAADVRRKLK